MTAHRNIFRVSADLLHVASFFILLGKIHSQKNCRGISLKTQILYCIVFICRYLDLFTGNSHDRYNNSFKVVFIVASIAVVWVMRFQPPYCYTYDDKVDMFNMWLLIGPCAVLGLIFNEEFSVREILWAFSIFLEAVAIVPQLFVVQSLAQQHSGFVEIITSHYVFALGGYRALYLLNWIYRYFTEDEYRDWIVWVAGTVQTVIYCDFFYYYLLAAFYRRKMVLPVTF